MLEEYLYEIIISIAVVTLIIIYFLTRKPQTQEENDVVQTSIDQSKETLEEDVEPPKENVRIEEVVKEIPEEIIFKSTRVKKDVPPHEKIKKDDFKEFAGVKLLVAEDNLINQKVITALLAGSGIEVTLADDGQIALDILEENSNFDIILMDAHMPRVDGFEASRNIRANKAYENIVIVAFSGDVASDDVKKMTEAGMESHIEKPLKMDALYDVLYAYTK